VSRADGSYDRFGNCSVAKRFDAHFVYSIDFAAFANVGIGGGAGFKATCAGIGKGAVGVIANDSTPADEIASSTFSTASAGVLTTIMILEDGIASLLKELNSLARILEEDFAICDTISNLAIAAIVLHPISAV
jgi:hypothetical protein